MKATMNIKTRSTRHASLVALATVATLQAAAANAAPKAGTPLFSQQAAQTLAGLPAAAKAQSARFGTLNEAVLTAPSIEVTLADGSKSTARMQRVARDDAKGVQSWIGTFDDSPGSLLVVTKARGVVSGHGTYKDQTFELQPAKDGKHALFAIDLARLPQRDGVVVSSTGGGDALTTASDYGTGGTTLATGTAVVHDVLVYYTPATAGALGTALDSNIQAAVQAANQAYLNSNVNLTLNVVGLRQSPVGESGSGMANTLNNFKQNSTVRTTRDQLAADMVLLVSQDSDWCGYANLTITSINGVTNTDAYGVVYSACLSNQTLAHEVGHLQGLDHNRENTTGTREYPYSYGYRRCVTGGFLDIMSYACPSISVPRISNFSNPSVFYNGFATGVSYEASPTTAAESARSLNANATKVAAYRVGSSSTVAPSVPSAPSGLAARSVAWNQVVVGWTDTSSNETGFKVERSLDGVTFTEVATLGAGAVSYSDVAVTATSNYYYRVRAYNSIGGSSFTNTLGVTTPALPPAPPVAPASVAAANNADGSALVRWTDASTNESSFEVRRETWNSRKLLWGSPTTIGTIPANMTSMVDLTGNGTYRYSVRAVNAGGASGLAGPAQVTVSGGTGRKVR
jgi:hypothetical protein